MPSGSSVNFQAPTAEDVFAVKPQIDAALVYANGCYEFVDILRAILAGKYQMWRKDTSVILTEVVDYPRKRVVVVFLAAGDQATLRQMVPPMEAWAIAAGCHEAWLTGRKGWARSFLKDDQWEQDGKVTLHRTLRSAL